MTTAEIAEAGGLLHRRLLKGAASNYAGRLASLALWFFFTPFVLHHLGPAEYGLWVVVGSVVGYGYVLNFGINAAIVRHVAQSRSRFDMDQTRRFLATAQVVYIALGFACFSLSALLAPYVMAGLRLSPEVESTATLVMILMGAEVGLAFPCGTGIAVLQGLQRYDLANVVTTGATVVTVIAMAMALLLGGGIVAMVAVTLPITVATQLASMLLVRRVAPDLPLGLSGVDRALVAPIFGFSAPLFVMQIAELLQRKTDEIVIAALLLVTAVTPYSLARRLADLTRRLTDQFVRVVLPLAAELNAADRSAELRVLYTAGTRLTLAVLLPMTCSLLVLGGTILAVWVGAQYADYESLVRVLAVAALASTSQGPAASILKGMARHRPLAISALCSGLLNLGLSLVLVGPFGLQGVALATLLPTLAESFGFVLPYTMWVLGVSISDVARHIILPTFIPAGLMIAALYAGLGVVHPNSLPSLVVVIAFGAVVYLMGYLSLGASPVERQLVRSLALQTVRLKR